MTYTVDWKTLLNVLVTIPNKDILFYSIHKIQKLKESLLSDNVYQDIPHSVIESLSVFLPI